MKSVHKLWAVEIKRKKRNGGGSFLAHGLVTPAVFNKRRLALDYIGQLVEHGFARRNMRAVRVLLTVETLR